MDCTKQAACTKEITFFSSPNVFVAWAVNIDGEIDRTYIIIVYVTKIRS